MIINSKLSDEALLKNIYRVASEYSNLIGNSYLIIGKNKKQQCDTSFPITLIPRCIDEFVSQKCKIVFVLEKKIEEEKYKKILTEVKKGLFGELYNDFPEEIKSCLYD